MFPSEFVTPTIQQTLPLERTLYITPTHTRRICVLDFMISLHINSYFVGPAESGNVYGGLTKNSVKRMLSGSLPYNTSVFVLTKMNDTETGEIHYVKLHGVAPTEIVHEYITSSSYDSLIQEYDAKVGTLSGSYVWESETFVL